MGAQQVGIHRDVAIGGELGEGNLRGARVQVDGQDADDDKRAEVRFQGFQSVEQSRRQRSSLDFIHSIRCSPSAGSRPGPFSKSAAT